MKLRTVVLALAGLGIPLALFVLVLPITWGYGGYNYRGIGNGHTLVYFVDPNGPAARAGLRVGDRVIPPRGYDAIAENGGSVGTVVHERVLRNNRVRVLDITFVPFFGQLAVQQGIDKILLALTALGAFLVAILVELRARDARVGSRAAMVLLLAGTGAFCQGAALVIANAWAAVLLAQILPIVFSGAALSAAVSLLAIYPPNRTRLRSALGILALVPLVCCLAIAFTRLYTALAAHPPPVIGFLGTLSPEALAVPLALYAMLALAILDAIASAPAAYAAPVRWLGGMWLLAVVFGVAPGLFALAGSPILMTHYGDALNAAGVFCLAFGVGYPVLRHRLVDLNILVSRATVFGIVSAIIVGIFIAAEWAIGKIFEQSVGLAGDRGVGPQLATLGVALLLGISARSIHRFVEERLTNTFFRKRLRGLAEIERVAREADAATDARAVMDIAVTTVAHCLEPLGVAFYLRTGESYDRASACGSLLFPAAYAFNDACPLRLRRWQEPFEIDDDSDDRHHMLFLPMTLRGELLGFLCCGPKPDRSAYLPDEIAALSLLAHHVGIASAWLQRTALTAPLTFAAT